MSTHTARPQDHDTPAPSRAREIAQLTLAHLINDIYAPVLMALQPLLITTLGYSYFQAALLPVMHSLISSLLQPVFGSLADKRGFRVSVAVSILLSGCGIALLGQLSDHYLIMLCCVAISAVGHATFHPGAFCKVDAIAASGNRGRLTSFFVVGGNLGQALGADPWGHCDHNGRASRGHLAYHPGRDRCAYPSGPSYPGHLPGNNTAGRSSRERELAASHPPLLRINAPGMGHVRGNDSFSPRTLS